MPIGMIFWVLMLLWLVFGVWRDWGNQWAMGGSLLQFVLFLLLGWHVFGAAVKF
jgi:hypothetical protein